MKKILVDLYKKKKKKNCDSALLENEKLYSKMGFTTVPIVPRLLISAFFFYLFIYLFKYTSHSCISYKILNSFISFLTQLYVCE